ncbi:energy-coupling factor transporter transmembrane component T [Arcanobacterium hippocoleae]
MAFSVPFGQFVNVDSPLHRLDPRVKIVLTGTLMAAVLAANSYLTLGVMVVFFFALAVLSRVPLGDILRAIRPIFFLMLASALLNLFAIRTGQVLVHWHFVLITSDGVRATIIMLSRLLCLMFGGALLSLTTPAIRFADALERMCKPLERFGFPAREMALMSSISLRFIPILFGEAQRIMKAQSARGADLGSGRLCDKVRFFIPILVPLFASALRHSDELAVAMEARCYSAGAERSRYRELRIGRSDASAIAAVSALAAGIAAMRVCGF